MRSWPWADSSAGPQKVIGISLPPAHAQAVLDAIAQAGQAQREAAEAQKEAQKEAKKEARSRGKKGTKEIGKKGAGGAAAAAAGVGGMMSLEELELQKHQQAEQAQQAARRAQALDAQRRAIEGKALQMEGQKAVGILSAADFVGSAAADFTCPHCKEFKTSVMPHVAANWTLLGCNPKCTPGNHHRLKTAHVGGQVVHYHHKTQSVHVNKKEEEEEEEDEKDEDDEEADAACEICRGCVVKPFLPHQSLLCGGDVGALCGEGHIADVTSHRCRTDVVSRRERRRWWHLLQRPVRCSHLRHFNSWVWWEGGRRNGKSTVRNQFLKLVDETKRGFAIV